MPGFPRPNQLLRCRWRTRDGEMPGVDIVIAQHLLGPCSAKRAGLPPLFAQDSVVAAAA